MSTDSFGINHDNAKQNGGITISKLCRSDVNVHSNGATTHPTVTVQLDDIPNETRIGVALQKLFRAYQFSFDCDRPKWDFAVGILELETMGISHDELRWMIGKGLIDHAREKSSAAGTRRSFDSFGGYTLTPESCFVITSAGSDLSRDLVHLMPAESAAIQIGSQQSIQSCLTGTATTEHPLWDCQRHELRVGTVVVKRFKWRALNQEAILNAFQEDGWPARIDDPLPPVADTDPKRRLSDAIKCLNRKQQSPIIRFSGDGTGEGVLWDFVFAQA